MRVIPVMLLLLSGCASWPADLIASCAPGFKRPAITTSADGRERSTSLSVLVYNVEGLPWPARKSRGRWLDRIGAELAHMRRQGTSPDVVLLQEVFTPRGAQIGVTAEYNNRVRGPSAHAAPSGGEATAEYRAARRLGKGERLGKILGSGLYILSDYPVMSAYERGFSKNACAGFDCLAAKGVMLARVSIPGVPTPVDIMTTHMNSKGRTAGVSPARTLAAHKFQTIESAQFLKEVRDSANPLIMGGDFNMKQSADRFDHFISAKPYAIVRQWCTDRPTTCDVRMSWDGDAPWLDTQDLQVFDDGAVVRVRPERVEALFDGPNSGGKLSDHDAYLVKYRLTWPAGAVPQSGLTECKIRGR